MEALSSPGGVGFDINCGVRFLRTDLIEEELGPRLEILVDTLYRNVPTGVGSKGKVLIKSHRELEDVMVKGARWAVEQGFGESEDTLATEERGGIAGGAPMQWELRLGNGGIPQLGTLGSGNHFLEIEVVDEVFDPAVAGAFGIDQVGQVMIHCGSRGLGHQICTGLP